MSTRGLPIRTAVPSRPKVDAGTEAVVFGKRVESVEAEFRKQHAQPGAIRGISPLLEERRLKYAIPNGAFKLQAAFDVVLVHQIPRYETETFGDTSIIMPQQARRRVEEETPRGIIVSAGCAALDALRTNGMDVGHIISFIRQAPWRMPVEMVSGVEFHLLILRAGDITGSEDLQAALQAGRARLVWNEEAGKHHYVDPEGKRWDPQLPFLPADY